MPPTLSPDHHCLTLQELLYLTAEEERPTNAKLTSRLEKVDRLVYGCRKYLTPEQQKVLHALVTQFPADNYFHVSRCLLSEKDRILRPDIYDFDRLDVSGGSVQDPDIRYGRPGPTLWSRDARVWIRLANPTKTETTEFATKCHWKRRKGVAFDMDRYF